jgi:hypothetical protein
VRLLRAGATGVERPAALTDGGRLLDLSSVAIAAESLPAPDAEGVDHPHHHVQESIAAHHFPDGTFRVADRARQESDT